MIKYLLLPFTIIYYLLSELNRLLTKKNKLDKPVISIGNITWGGSGKTPMTLEVAKYILSLGKTPVILSRGYARKNKEIKWIDASKSLEENTNFIIEEKISFVNSKINKKGKM